jgi:hypothetical protein
MMCRLASGPQFQQEPFFCPGLLVPPFVVGLQPTASDKSGAFLL